MNHIFISYSRRDTEYVNIVADGLRQSGLSVWQDISGKGSGIPFSTKWFSAIEEALHSSAGAVVFRSEHWHKSVPCRREYDIVENLCIPCFKVDPNEEGFPAAENVIEEIKAWAETEVYGQQDNDIRTWLLSSLSSYKNTHRLNTGIPHYRTKEDADAFMERLMRAETIIREKEFDVRMPDLYRDMVRFLKHARRVTVWDRIKKPLALALAALLVCGIVFTAVRYRHERERTLQHLAALQNLDQIHDVMAYDEIKAMNMMIRDENEYGDYITLLFENYAEALDAVYPSAFYPAGSQEAEETAAMSLQHDSPGYDIRLSENTGIVEVEKEAPEGIAAETVSFIINAAPQAYAVQDGYLAAASYQQVWLHDLARGTGALELKGCRRDIRDVFFDEEGQIRAVTEAGDVYVWQNPIAGIISSEDVSAEITEEDNGSFVLETLADGTISVIDAKRDCVIYTCSWIREPIQKASLDTQSWQIRAVGFSGASYILDASSVLADYDARDALKQKENYDRLAQSRCDFVINELQILKYRE